MASSTASSTRTNLGPLTTTFVPPSTCSGLGITDKTADVAYQAQRCSGSTQDGDSTYNLVDDSNCWPSTSSGVSSQPQPLGGWGIYSPGLVCPIGYHSACITGYNTDDSPAPVTGTLFSFQFPLNAGETGVGCCPSHYFCTTAAFGYQTCLSHVTDGAIEVTQCADVSAASTYSLSIPITKASPTVSTLAAYAPMVQLVWQSKDEEAITLVQSTVTVTPTSNPASGLDAGDKTGIGVGVVAAFLLVLAAVLGWLLIRARRAQPTKDEGVNLVERPFSGKDHGYGPSPEETAGTPLNELESSNAELPGDPMFRK